MEQKNSDLPQWRQEAKKIKEQFGKRNIKRKAIVRVWRSIARLNWVSVLALGCSIAALIWQYLGLGHIEFFIDSKDGVSIVSATVGLLGVSAAAGISYVSSKRIKFFDTYFQKKSQAFSMFISLIDIANYTSKESLENMKGAVAWGNTCLLYCNDENVRLMKDFMNYLCDIYRAELYNLYNVISEHEKHSQKIDEIDFEEYKEVKDIIVTILREELKACRNFKFN